MCLQRASGKPIERGGRFGISGNGHHQLQIRNMLKTPTDLSGSNAGIDLNYVESVSTVLFDYFSCPGCDWPI
jgi:hypothetical protein